MVGWLHFEHVQGLHTQLTGRKIALKATKEFFSNYEKTKLYWIIKQSLRIHELLNPVQNSIRTIFTGFLVPSLYFSKASQLIPHPANITIQALNVLNTLPHKDTYP
ncbi:Uncharacterised protein [uncultured archaeon]|nr:Uncharacterised protein [uncultured archaeon]